MESVGNPGTEDDAAGWPVRSAPSQAKPELVVLIPVFNGQAALERSLASLCADGYRFDVFVIDDGSDPPIQILPNLPFNIRLIVMPKNIGITKALNAGLAPIMKAGYRYIARLDAGDISLPGRCAAQVAFLNAHPDHAVVGSYVEYVDHHKQQLFVYRPSTEHVALNRVLKYRNGLEHPAVMMRAEALKESGGYDDKYYFSQDYELWRRLMKNYKLANLPTIFVKKEVTPTQITARPFRSATRLRVQIRYFSPWSVDAYLGVLRTLLALLTGRRLVLRAKHLGQRLQSGKAQR